MSTEIEKALDSYEMHFTAGGGEHERLLNEVRDMEAHSEWLENVESKSLRLTPNDAPLLARDSAKQYNLEPDLTLDTALPEGTNLIAHMTLNDVPYQSWNVRPCARGTLCETAKLNGSALGRMGAEKLAQTLNNGLEVARGCSTILIRCGKATAFHSDSYKQMAISELLDITQTEVGSRFGKLEFIGGVNTHAYTQAVYYLPDVQKDLTAAYIKALSPIIPSHYNIRAMMPGIRFSSSDTASAAARVIPFFAPEKKGEIRFVEGVAVKHEKKCKADPQQQPAYQQLSLQDPAQVNGTVSGIVVPGGGPAVQPDAKEKLDGVDLFREDVKNLYSMFIDAVNKAGELSQIEIWNPVNAVVSLCNRFSIPKKYGDAAREQADTLAQISTCLSAHDVYLCMNRVITQASLLEATPTTMNFLMEAVSKVLSVSDWSEHDVGGVVAWK